MKQMAGPRGFTLMEMMVVVAIVGVMSAMSAAGIASVVSRGKVNSAASITARLAGNARVMAVSQGCGAGIEIRGVKYGTHPGLVRAYRKFCSSDLTPINPLFDPVNDAGDTIVQTAAISGVSMCLGTGGSCNSIDDKIVNLFYDRLGQLSVSSSNDGSNWTNAGNVIATMRVAAKNLDPATEATARRVLFPINGGPQ